MLDWHYWGHEQWGVNHPPAGQPLRECQQCNGDIERIYPMVMHCNQEFMHLECFVLAAHRRPRCPICMVEITPMDGQGNRWVPPNAHI